MTRQNLFSDLWDGENEEAGTRRRVFWRPDDARMAATLYELAPGTPEAAYTCITEPKRCSSSSAAARCSGTSTAKRRSSRRLRLLPEGWAGLHTFSNPTDEPVGILAISAGSFPDVVAYPEHGYAWVATRDPDRNLLAEGGDRGSQVFYTDPMEPDLVVVSVGSFADASFPPPTESGYDSRRHPWVGLPESVQQFAPELWWDSARPLYEAAKHAEAAEKGRELINTRPDQPYLFYNTACCESLAGQTADAIQHLQRAIEMWDGFREMARDDADFDPVRDNPAFRSLISR